VATERALLECFAVLGAAYPNFNATRETITVYHRVLSDLPDELLQTACLDAISKSRFFPTVAELRDAAIAIRTNRLALPSPFEAWEEICAEMRRVGYMGAPKFSHPWITNSVRQIGGWQRLCLSENAIADRARFFEAMDDARRRNDLQEHTLPQVRELALRLAGPKRALLSETEK